MQPTTRPSVEQVDMVLEAIRSLGATVEQAAYYGGLRPRALLAELQANPDLRLEIAIARDAFRDSQSAA